MKKTLIIYKPEYTELAVKLRDNYRAHNHEAANIVSVEEHDDIEYAEKMQYDEVVFIEDTDTVTVHDIESGYTNRVPVSDVFYNDPKPDFHEAFSSRDELSEAWQELTHEQKNHELFLKQKALLQQFLSTGAISQAQHDKSLRDLREKMGEME